MYKNKDFITEDDVNGYRISSILPEGSRLTKYDCSKPVSIGGALFRFDYRRDTFDFTLEQEKFEYLGIPSNGTDSLTEIFLTNSGQAAIHAAYFYIDKILKIKEIESHNDYLYVGAYRLQDLYQIKHTKNKSTCLWICSTTTRFDKILEIEGEWDVVVVDTTCWAVGSAELKKVYAKFKNNDLVIFFRSHSKLDMGGVEYGSLGNLTLLSKNSNIIKFASKMFREILGLNGGYAVLDEIPPYLFSKEFFHSSQKRVQTIVDNTKAIEKTLLREMGLNCKYGDLIFPDHYKYFFLRLNSNIDEELVRHLVKRCMVLLKLYLPEAKSCASFGFNFPSLTFYRSDEDIGHFFRFSTGIISNEKTDKLALCIKEAFKK